MKSLEAAQAALGILLIEREVCSLGQCRSARFDGPLRNMSSRGERQALVVAPGTREEHDRQVEEPGSNLFSAIVDAYYEAATKARHRRPTWLFENEDGSLKAGCTVSSLIKRFTAENGVAMSPMIVRELRVLKAKRTRGSNGGPLLDDEALRDLVGASTTDNARYRYAFIDELEAGGRLTSQGEG